MAMQDFLNNVKGAALGAAEIFVPVLKESKFRETGVLTPEEFVIAGDHLVHHCPTWQWSSGEQSKTKPYLPADKHFLLTKNVPCYRRFHQLEAKGQEKIIEIEGDTDGGWVDTHPDGPGQDSSATSAPVMETAQSTGGKAAAGAADSDDDDDEEAGDMEDFLDSGMLDANDPGTLLPTTVKTPSQSAEEEGIEQTRTYDLHITYDKYYQTPRLWLIGYNEARKPLSVEQMYEDFSADHAKKTITMESHPHVSGPPMASIHPCRHAEVMKKIIQTVADGGRELDVHNYLVIFLKFVQAVIPTIEYDYTRNFSF
ncbi:Ubiquitin-like-conjugating enzyme ATG3 [Hypsibius exemplaris]|uniref:Ubiquitin-like-conjugating enzyme ATG3 n=1 Tax=Hypsibius exemplaris TaxID=2072580 RepID=A0A1W0XAY4_HYPEX|nr:Ubiquitin-like-conjugating enzyme ATG3 [Hypsibius exemplaris]